MKGKVCTALLTVTAWFGCGCEATLPELSELKQKESDLCSQVCEKIQGCKIDARNFVEQYLSWDQQRAPATTTYTAIYSVSDCKYACYYGIVKEGSVLKMYRYNCAVQKLDCDAFEAFLNGAKDSMCARIETAEVYSTGDVYIPEPPKPETEADGGTDEAAKDAGLQNTKDVVIPEPSTTEDAGDGGTGDAEPAAS